MTPAALHEEHVARVWLDGEPDECAAGHPVPTWRGLCAAGHRGAVALRLGSTEPTTTTEAAA